MGLFRRSRAPIQEIAPDEILLDARNLPEYTAGTLEGRLARPLGGRASRVLTSILIGLVLIATYRMAELQLVEGSQYAAMSANNTLDHTTVFAPRGVIYDRTGTLLAWNVPRATTSAVRHTDTRAYASTTGIAHVLGYVRLPRKDSSGNYYSEVTEGVAGAELAYNELLSGKNGIEIVETDARMDVVSSGVLKPAESGEALHLTIDAAVQSALYESIARKVSEIPFRGGAGVLMDVTTGEVLALTSAPEYRLDAVMSGDPSLMGGYDTDRATPYLNRALSGVYTPGSIVKPYFAAAALQEGLVRPETTFVSTGALYLPNPYNPGNVSVFNDWRAHGSVDVRRALAVSSNVYFYYVGGGFGGREGLGITRLGSYAREFGFGAQTGVRLAGEAAGVVPSPAWKKETFGEDEEWRLGDTYHTAIGQYGFLVTPLQAARALASIANGGSLVTPRIAERDPYAVRTVDLEDRHLKVVREGMRQAVEEGIARALNVPYLAVAGKTGTAEIDAAKQYVNSWVTAFFPYDEPRYVLVLMLEHGPRSNLIGASAAAREFLDWLHDNRPEYVGQTRE